ncbi:metallophosphoesterase [Arthrobacter sp. Z4-13]
MALLLHLSDLHLTAGGGDTLSDAKVAVVARSQQQTRIARIKSSLRNLGEQLTLDGQTLDAIVITGDVTEKGSPEGFDLLPAVLAPLGKSLPNADRILVVPGNHDVAWGTPPSSSDRYEAFLRLRSHGYRTALLDGVDFDENGAVVPDVLPPVLVALDSSYVVIGLNSSDYSGVEAATNGNLEAHLQVLEQLRESEPAVEALYQAWKARGRFDMARVGRTQFRVASDALSTGILTTRPEPLRIAALHHQVIPVGTSEEIKPFEAILNLGELRDWLATNKIDVAIHGHKHEARVLSDSFMTLQGRHGTALHEMTIISAPALQPGGANDTIGRLLDVRQPLARVHGIDVRDVPTCQEGTHVPLSAFPTVHQPIDLSPARGLLEAATAEGLHEKLLALRDRLHLLPSPLVCRVEDGTSALTVSQHYVDIPEGHDRQEWFDQAISWWQRETAGRAASFNHGERLFASEPGEASQIESAARALSGKGETSRAVAVLVRPATDFRDETSEFPAFVTVQFLVRDSKIHLIAYFRKQEMPHWWPINMGELASLQASMIRRLSRSKCYAPGSITTITAMPVNGQGVPKVAVPAIDRHAEDPLSMMQYVLPLFGLGSDPFETVMHRWESIFNDWMPGQQEPADGDPVPSLGFEILNESIEQVNQVAPHSRPVLSDLCSQIRLLSHDNAVFAELRDPSLKERAQWEKKVVQARITILGHVRALLETQEDAPVS